jgi:5-methylcytosine-specific restriction endonuclease McrA
MSENNHTLVLNKNWVAATVTTSFGALISMCRERSQAMCPESYTLFDINNWMERSKVKMGDLSPEQVIYTTRQAVEKPEIIILKEYGGIPFKQVNFTRRNLYKRDGYTCQYCLIGFIPKELTIDHVIPRSRGGSNDWTNCVTSCEYCNSKKADRTPQESGMKLHRAPKMPKWTPIAGMLPAQRPDSWNKFLKI